MYSKASKVLLALVAGFGLMACGDDTESGGDAPAVAVERKAPVPSRSPRVPVEETPAASPVSEEGDDLESYVAEGKRDPFRSFHFKNPEEPVVSMGPLADFDLAQLVVVGVVWNTTNPRALVADPAGRSFVLREGSSIGKNRGQVVQIKEDMILVQEKFVDFEGAVSTKDVEIRIEKRQGG